MADAALTNHHPFPVMGISVVSPHPDRSSDTVAGWKMACGSYCLSMASLDVGCLVFRNGSVAEMVRTRTATAEMI
jgi:hypothetical protein